MSLELHSPCKVNLLLNILGRRPDGFHELETVLQPVGLNDVLRLAKGGRSVQLTCSEPSLPTDRTNLAYRAALDFLKAAGIDEGVSIHLEKRLPIAAGLGGGSANAATTLRGLNALFGNPLTPHELHRIAADLGSDVPFFLQDGPAVGTGRGEIVEPVPPFACLRGAAILLVRPGFGVSTPWAYRELANYPDSLHGRKGRAGEFLRSLKGSHLSAMGPALFNSLEAPVFHKFPLLMLLKEFLLEQGAAGALMSGSGSTTFAIARSPSAAGTLRDRVLERFGGSNWTAIAPL